MKYVCVFVGTLAASVLSACSADTDQNLGAEPGAREVDGGGGSSGNSGVDAGLNGEPDSGATPALDRALIQLGALSPLGTVPADPTNAYADDPRAQALGQQLFFDQKFSGPLLVSS